MRNMGWSLLWVSMFGFSLPACSINRETLGIMGKVPDEHLKSDLYGAIWGDLKMDVFLGNGGWAAILSEAEATGRIQDIRCQSSKRPQHCAFDLLIEGGSKRVREDVEVPEALRCTVRFIYTDEGWAVDHLPPKGGGHSRTTLQCKKPESGGRISIK